MSNEDTMLIRDTRHLPRIMTFVERLPALREERLPGASVSQSLYDKIGLTCEYPSLLPPIYGLKHSP